MVRVQTALFSSIEHLGCKLGRLKRAGELDETGSDWMLLVLCDNGFVFKQLCSALEGDIEQLRCKLSRLKRAGELLLVL